MHTFQAGKTYSARSICDADHVTRMTVASRTAKTITTDKGKRLRIDARFGDTERVFPNGRYSMALQITAERAA